MHRFSQFTIFLANRCRRLEREGIDYEYLELARLVIDGVA